MPYVPRILDPDGYYHVICRGNNKSVVFRDEHDFMKYRELVAHFKEKTPFFLYHYILMPNHVHLQLRADSGQSLSEIMKRISHTYSLYYKRRYGFVGHLWQGRFKSKLIETDSYMLTCGIYIELNPVRAGLVKDAIDYPWSSFTSYLTHKKDPLVDHDPEFLALSDVWGERVTAYRALVKMWMDLPRTSKKVAPTFDVKSRRY